MSKPSRRAAAARRDGRRAVGAGIALATWARLHREMADAAPRTIAHRLEMMRLAVGDPVALSDPEFSLMGREKAEAAAAAANAMIARGPAMLGAWMAWGWDQAQANARLLTDLASCRTAPDLLAAQARFADASLSRAATAGAKLTQSTAEMMLAGLRPVHKVARANAVRLGRPRKRPCRTTER